MCSPGQVECSFENMSKENAKKLIPFAKCTKKVEKLNLFQQTFSSKFSSSHSACSFDHTADDFAPRAWEFLDQCLKLIGKNSSKIFPKKCFSRAVECSIDIPAKKYSQNRNFFVQGPKKLWRSWFTTTKLQNNYSGHAEGSFDNLAETVLPKNRRVFVLGLKKNF